MSTEHSIDDIVNDALDLPGAERAVFVRSACAGDASLESEVMSLLAAYESAGEFLEDPPLVEAADSPSLAGRTIGAYRLGERIGKGGMGDVYLAERREADYEQQVAIKIVRGTAFGPDGGRRFRNECRVLAKLEHPNIARMLEGGFTDDGIAYIVMEYVDGVTIDRHCHDNRLGIEKRLTLVRDLCLAVHHIHQHSTIHRDIKCANVLVTPGGIVKLVDFGIAQVLDTADDTTPRTVTGMEVMTPQYASPEQLRGDVLTTASDIYSIGVVLYRTLTGRLPFSGRNRREMEREVEETGPTRPSTAVTEGTTVTPARQLRGDIDTIVLMALRKEPERRYASAEQFGEDLRRHLDGLPVIARPDTLRYRASKFVRRNAWAVGGLMLFVVTLCVAVVAGFSLYSSADRAREIAVRERATAEGVSSFLQELLAAADPSVVGTRHDMTVREVLDSAARRLNDELPGEPALKAMLHTTIGAAYLNLGAFDEADVQISRAIELYEALDVSNYNGHADALLQRAKLHEKRTEYGPAEDALTEAIEILDGDMQNDPALLSECEVMLAMVLVEGSRLEEAETMAVRARETASRITDPLSPMPVTATTTLGRVLYRAGRYDESESRFGEAVVMARERLGERHAITGEVLQNHAVALGTLGRTSEAIAEYEEALDVYAVAYPEDHPELGTTRLNLADAYFGEGRNADALESYLEAKRLLTAAYGDNHVYVALAINGEAMCRWRLDGPSAAEPLFKAAVTILRANLGDDHPWVATPSNNWARVIFELGDHERARREARAALATLRATYPDGHATTSRPLLLLAEIDLAENRNEEALSSIDEAVVLCANLPLSNLDRLRVILTHADCLAALQRTSEARNMLLYAKAELDTTLAPDDERRRRIDAKLEALGANPPK